MSAFTLYPAIDIRNGKCVRLIQGDYAKETIYGDSPFEMASSFVGEGAEWVHLVDLDGAKEGKTVNHSQVIKIAKQLKVKVQIGGGIRTEKDIENYLSQGIERVILGSATISNPGFVKKMLKNYGNHIAIGLDARNGFVSTEGWLKTSTVKAEELGLELANEGAEVFIFTDIATDGMLSGPNVNRTVELAKTTGKQVIASGGISCLADLEELANRQPDGISGAIVGKAFYTKQFTMKEALERINSK
ncbi:1-(5-phosphoribosyl)-5-[(5-phosphoribosylamino)methylideneamino]imidazole-4-carboxamide isomerase [Bacillus changyiensis]|uniref:1-(5-phosphoribosyl)-5-[(5- phosphoribosylamino)methylideneamino]imidazole-4- carboxamide isomerase n=1 Tax=Bacillus changyiensis TaxID=3004103 RepID=UPI0022E08707|nr:1-(5-phosphoribosyl)-5-[(5-phosphoribosylamino)methylideneamino]imidazole-4-carboxamide isomerase [Bacillus changyiensis]MDA1476512.1 1-(5-phosphoribosyl)-5-[(5-phosphoribosylamino)methylideneamino]imidazole-4-carboxamide isomerase [Bacillus changyiensis]